MIIPELAHRSIVHINILFIYLLEIHLGISILSTSRRCVPVRVPLGKIPHIVTRFTTAVTVSRDCNMLGISTSTNPAVPTTSDPTWWRCSSLGGNGHDSSHYSGDGLTHHDLKRHRLGLEGSLISSRKIWFISRCSRPRAMVPVISINKLFVLGSSRQNYLLKVQTIRLRYK